MNMKSVALIYVETFPHPGSVNSPKFSLSRDFLRYKQSNLVWSETLSHMDMGFDYN